MKRVNLFISIFTILVCSCISLYASLSVDIIKTKDGAKLYSVKKNNTQLLKPNKDRELFRVILKNKKNNKEKILKSSSGWGSISTQALSNTKRTITLANPTDNTLAKRLKAIITLEVIDDKSIWDLKIEGLKNYTIKDTTFPNPYTQSSHIAHKGRAQSKKIHKEIIGARKVRSSAVSKGTIFASPNGDDNGICSITKPCSLTSAVARLKAGDILFLRGGIYKRHNQININKKGTAQHPIIIESYPNEMAIIEGKYNSPNYLKNHIDSRYGGFRVDYDAKYIYFRKLHIRYMGWNGIVMRGNHCLVEGCEIDHCCSAGIGLWSGKYEDYPHTNGHNIIRDNIIHDNSDIGSKFDGGNADGIWVGTGIDNKIVHNTVYHNSDDGIDTWRSNNSYVAYNISYLNGQGSKGDGNGFKTGGVDRYITNLRGKIGLHSVLVHNISYANKSHGFDYNSGMDVLFKNNTSFNNAKSAFRVGSTTILKNNISSQDGEAMDREIGTNNSWNKKGKVSFISTDPSSKNFLQIAPNSIFSQMGAYATNP